VNANERILSNIGHLSKDMLDCYRLWDTVKALLEKEELLEPFINQEMKIVPILARMETEGIGFDPEELSKNKKKLEVFRVNIILELIDNPLYVSNISISFLRKQKNYWVIQFLYQVHSKFPMQFMKS